MFGRFIQVLLASAVAADVYGQFVTQQITLEPGWNSVYLTIQPVPSSCSTLFGAQPVESVSWWCPPTIQAEFDDDPSQTFPREPNWKNWYNGQQSAQSTFGSLLVGEAYLVKASNACQIEISGVPRILSGSWFANSVELTGLPVSTSNTLSFAHFFSFTDDILVGSSEINSVATDGSYQTIFLPTHEPIIHGNAFWMQCDDRNSDYFGPLKVSLLSSSTGIDFSGSFVPRKLRIENVTDSDRQVTLRQLESEDPPEGGGFPDVAGMVPLSYARMDFSQFPPREEYVELPDLLITNIPPNSSMELKILPDRARSREMVGYEAYQGILQISDENNDGESEPALVQQLGVSWDAAPLDYTGLWAGAVTVTHVSRAQTQLGVSNVWDHTLPVPVVRPYTFRVIMHRDSNGRVHLLQRVLSAWIPDGEVVYDGDGFHTNGIVELFTDEAYAEDYLAAHPDAKISRISSVNLPLMAPVEMSGGLDLTSQLQCTVDLPFDDPVNPFVHRYHPMHDNLEYNNDGSASPLGEGVESPGISRTMEFIFAETDPVKGGGNMMWGDRQMGGVFTETATGLNKTIYVKGQFRLEKISDCDVLKYLDQ